MGGHTKQMQGDRLTGDGLQYLLINTLGLKQAARSVVLHCEIYGLLDGRLLLALQLAFAGFLARPSFYCLPGQFQSATFFCLRAPLRIGELPEDIV